MKIGLSLSLCIKDIIEGKVDINDVYCIITATQAYDQKSWNRLVEDYERNYWRNGNGLGSLLANKMHKLM